MVLHLTLHVAILTTLQEIVTLSQHCCRYCHMPSHCFTQATLVITLLQVPLHVIRGVHRVDSIEAMLAAIPSRFSMEKSLSLDSPSQNAPSSPQAYSGATPIPSSIAAHPQSVAGIAAIPSRRSRDVPGLQPDIVSLSAHAPHGCNVTADVAKNGDMPRSVCSATCAMVVKHMNCYCQQLRLQLPRYSMYIFVRVDMSRTACHLGCCCL